MKTIKQKTAKRWIRKNQDDIVRALKLGDKTPKRFWKQLKVVQNSLKGERDG